MKIISTKYFFKNSYNKVVYVKRQVETMLMNDGNLMEMAKETN